MKQHLKIAITVILHCGTACFVHAAMFQGLGDLGGGSFSSHANDISANGQVVVGRSVSANGTEAFRWTRTDGLVNLNTLPGRGVFIDAKGVSSDGSVIVGRGVKTQWHIGHPPSSAFRWTAPGGAVEIAQGSATAVSADGSVVIGDSNLPLDFSNKLFRWTQSTGPVAIPQPNSRTFPAAISSDGSVIVGHTNAGAGISLSSVLAFRWTQEDGFTTFRSFDFNLLTSPQRPFSINKFIEPQSSVTWMSNDGSVLIGSATEVFFPGIINGSSNPPIQLNRGFQWTPETGMVKRDGLEPPFEVLANGSIVVGGISISNSVHNVPLFEAFLVTNLGLDLTDWTLTRITGISDDGLTIVGNGTNPDGFEEAWIAVIPEPASLTILIFGSVALLRRRRASSSSSQIKEQA